MLPRQQVISVWVVHSHLGLVCYIVQSCANLCFAYCCTYEHSASIKPVEEWHLANTIGAG